MFIMYCVVAAACAGIAAFVVPGRVPGGFITAVLFGVVGAWLGGALMGSVGPAFFGISIIPAVVGSAILVFCLSLFSRRAV